MFNIYSKIVSEAKYKTKYREMLKILTPNEMLQRLPIAPAQVKGNTSKKLLKKYFKSYTLCMGYGEK